MATGKWPLISGKISPRALKQMIGRENASYPLHKRFSTILCHSCNFHSCSLLHFITSHLVDVIENDLGMWDSSWAQADCFLTSPWKFLQLMQIMHVNSKVNLVFDIPYTDASRGLNRIMWCCKHRWTVLMWRSACRKEKEIRIPCASDSFLSEFLHLSIHSARHRSSELGPKAATPLLHKKGNQINEGKDGRSLGHVGVKTVRRPFRYWTNEGWNISWNELAFAFHRLNSCRLKECTILCHSHNPCIFDDCIFLKIVLFAVERTWKDSCGGRRNLTLKGTGCNIWKFIMQLSCFSECFLGVMALLFALTLLKQPSSGYVQLRAWKDSTAWLQYVAILARCWYRSWTGLWVIESQSETLSNSLQSQILQICAVNHSSSAPEKIYVHFTHPLSGIKEIPGASCIDTWVGGGCVNDCYCSGGICPMARKPKLKEGEKVLRLLDWIGVVLRVYVKVYNGYDIMNNSCTEVLFIPNMFG